MRNVRAARLYVLGAADGLMKVGRSAQPETRLKTIATANGVAVHLHHVSPERDDSSYVEAAAHRLLANKRRAGEWFDVTPTEAVAAIEAAIREVETIKAARRCKGCAPLPWGQFYSISDGQKKTPLALKFDTDLLKRLDRFVADQEIAVTRTSVIETAVRQLLERDGKRK